MHFPMRTENPRHTRPDVFRHRPPETPPLCACWPPQQQPDRDAALLKVRRQQLRARKKNTRSIWSHLERRQFGWIV